MKLEEWIAACRKHPGRRARFNYNHTFRNLDEMFHNFSAEKILEAKFELEPLPPQTIAITRELFDKAFEQACLLPPNNAFRDRIAASLGFRNEEA